MKLDLKNPIIFFDLETTGINVASDRIVEISYIKVQPNGTEETKTYRVNPTIPIPKESSDIHGILDKDVKDEPTFAELAKKIAADFEGCDLAGYSSNKFDIPLLAEEMIRAEVDIDFKKRKFVDVQVIFLKKEPRTLTAAYKYFCDKSLENAHSAEADTRATYEILQAQLDRYPDLENDIEKLSEFSSHTNNADFAGRIVFNKKGEECFNFGKHKGKTVVSVFEKDPGYYSWMINNDFPLYTKNLLTSIKLRSAFLNNKSK